MPDTPTPPPASEPSAYDATRREGRVVESTGAWVHVDVEGAIVAARVRGRLRLGGGANTNPVAVGDRVMLTREADHTGVIDEVLPRTNALRRRAAGRRVGVEAVLAANLDRAWIVQSVDLPSLNPGLVDRFLVTCDYEGIAAGIVVNKNDLAETDALRAARDTFTDLYRGLGYPVLVTSTETDEGLDDWRAALSGQTSVVAGASGVGKSSLLNAVVPGVAQRVGEISGATRKGKHTTTNAILLPIPDGGGGYVVDTPGIREFGVVEVEPESLGFHFVEFRPFIGQCRFQPCTHDHEPDCAVMAALDAGQIAESRMDGYLSILDSLRLGDRGR